MNNLTILTGCFGCGKSEIAIQMSLDSSQAGIAVSLLDMDLINPYFKSSASKERLRQAGVKVVAPLFAGSGIEAPSLPPEMGAALLDTSAERIVDLGGDTAGATVLGSFADRIRDKRYSFLYVHNPFRPYTHDAESSLGLMQLLRRHSRLEITGIVNNANLMAETEYEHLLQGDAQCAELARISGLPVIYHCLPASLAGNAPALAGQRLVLTLNNRPGII